MADVSAEFFDLPEQEKDKIRSAGQGLWQGWVPVYRGDRDFVEPGVVPDLVEWFQGHEFERQGSPADRAAPAQKA